MNRSTHSIASRTLDTLRQARHGYTRRRAQRPAAEQLENRVILSTFDVTNALDDGSPGSLRWAIIQANGGGTPAVIDFQINSGAQTIAVNSALPALTVPATIDATTQAGYGGSPVVTLDGVGIPPGLAADGLTLAVPGITVQGLAIGNFAGDGIAILNGGDAVQGDDIGVSPYGVAMPNGQDGIVAFRGGNTIGGTSAGQGNIVSGNGGNGVHMFDGNNLVVGNIIGLAPDGETPLGNGQDGVKLSAQGDTVGGTTVAARNIISGNQVYGVHVLGAGTLVEGNYIGTDIAGAQARGNGSGVWVAGSGATIGGTATGAGNIVAGNNDVGIGLGTGCVVQGNKVGTDQSGKLRVANNTGVLIEGSGNLIGGTDGRARNVISGNTTGIACVAGSGNQAAGNWIGLDASGLAALPNHLGVTWGGGNTLGDAAGAPNVISGNSFGIELTGSGQGCVVAGNLVGTDASGEAAVGNSVGIWLAGQASGYTIGGTAPAERNLVSGNANGFFIDGSGVTGNHVEGNMIGSDASGASTLPDGIGVFIADGASGNTIGGTAAAANTITGNASDGIRISGAGTSGNLVAGNLIGGDGWGNGGNGVSITDGASGNTVGGSTAEGANAIVANGKAGVLVGRSVTDSATGNAILINSIYGNAGLGIDLGNDGVTPNDSHAGQAGPNNWQDFPVLARAVGGSTTEVCGSMPGTACVTYIVDFYASPAADASGFGQGGRYLGQCQIAGQSAFEATNLAASALGDWITATATDPSGNTSEFSLAVPAKATPVFSSLSNPTIVIGTPYASLSGVLSFGAYAPTGSVSITVDGTALAVPIASDGSFSASFPTASFPAGSYIVTYSYAGDSSFTAAGSTSRLAVTYGISTQFSQTKPHHSGSQIPISLQLIDASGNNVGSATTAVTAVCVIGSNGNQAPLTSPGSSNLGGVFRYDPTWGTYQFNLKTSGYAAGGYTIYFLAGDDPNLHSLSFVIG